MHAFPGLGLVKAALRYSYQVEANEVSNAPDRHQRKRPHRACRSRRQSPRRRRPQSYRRFPNSTRESPHHPIRRPSIHLLEKSQHNVAEGVEEQIGAVLVSTEEHGAVRGSTGRYGGGRCSRGKLHREIAGCFLLTLTKNSSVRVKQSFFQESMANALASAPAAQAVA